MFKKSPTQKRFPIPALILLLVISVSACMLQDNSKKTIALTSDGWKAVTEQSGDVLDSFNYQVTLKRRGFGIFHYRESGIVEICKMD